MSIGQEIAVAAILFVIIGGLVTFVTLGQHYGLFREEQHYP
jgi:hypothetical protein